MSNLTASHKIYICLKIILILNIIINIHFHLTFTFDHLADAFIQSDLQKRRAIEAIKLTIGQQYARAATLPSLV